MGIEQRDGGSAGEGGSVIGGVSVQEHSVVLCAGQCRYCCCSAGDSERGE